MKKAVTFLLCALCLIGLFACGRAADNTVSRYTVGDKYYIPEVLFERMQISFDTEKHTMTVRDADGNTVTCLFDEANNLLRKSIVGPDGTETKVTVFVTGDDGRVDTYNEIYGLNGKMLRYTLSYNDQKNYSGFTVKVTNEDDSTSSYSVAFDYTGNGLARMNCEGVGTAYWYPFGIIRGTDVSVEWKTGGKNPSVTVRVDGTQNKYALREVSEAEAVMFRRYADFAGFYDYLFNTER